MFHYLNEFLRYPDMGIVFRTALYMYIRVLAINWGEPERAHTNHVYEKIAVLTYLCIYVCICIYVAIRRPRVYHAGARFTYAERMRALYHAYR